MKNEMTAEEANEAADRLDEIRDEIKMLIHEAMMVIQGSGEEMRAESYWHAHISGALDRDEYPGGSMITMEETENALRNGDED